MEHFNLVFEQYIKSEKVDEVRTSANWTDIIMTNGCSIATSVTENGLITRIFDKDGHLMAEKLN